MSNGFDFSGFDKFQKDFDKKIKKASGNVSFDELFNRSFMIKNSKFKSFGELLDYGGYTVNNEEDFKAIPDIEFDRLVQKTTKFKNWEEMLSTAGAEHFEKNLKF